LKVDELILLTDVDGVFSKWPDKNSLISELTLDQALELMPNLAAGMLPKLEAAITALKSGVPKVRILNGSDGEALLISQSNNASIGTVIS
jgi:acetylglutamate kinase